MLPLLSRLCCLALLVTGTAAVAATPPTQPKTGPGGSDYRSASVVKKGIGRASAGSYVFYPAGAPAEPRPVVVFLHAWGAINPAVYSGWIEHLARRGNLVVFPAFQDVGKTRPADATGTAVSLLKEAFEALAADPEAKPDLNRVAILGHSAGAGIGVNLAALAKAESLPVPKLVFALMPGGIASDAKSRGIALADLGQIDPATLVITEIGDREFQASDRAAKRILREATEVPPNRKLFVRALSDDHGFPAMSATLASPGSSKEGYDAASLKLPPDPPRDPKAKQPPRPKWSADMVLTGEQTVLVQQLGLNGTDTLDYLAFWKTFDMAAEYAFTGRDGQALRNEPSFSDMGRWSDGWPVKRLFAETPKSGETGSTPPAARAAPAPSKMPVLPRQGRPRR